MHQEKENHDGVWRVQPEINDISNEKSHLLVLPYAGQKGERLIKSMTTTLKYSLPNNVVTKSAYLASRVSNKFNMKSKTKHDDHHDLTCYVKCSVQTCREDYIGETGRRLSECVIDHSGCDKNYHVLKHYWKGAQIAFSWRLIILRTNYKKNKFRRKISESLYIKERCWSLNTQEKSVPLKLFNWVGNLAGTN